MVVRAAVPEDRDGIWPILEPVIRAGETYCLPRDMDRDEALDYWFAHSHEVFVATDDGRVLGTYFMQPNQRGGGAHVANCGYMTSIQASGKGIARAMATHSMEHAKALGFRAIQFNFVVSTNERAVNLWKSLGFEVVGRIPRAFSHPTRGFVDAYVMYQALD